MKLLYHTQVERLTVFSTTRQGGFSQGEYATMNVNAYCGDDAYSVSANRALLCQALSIDSNRLVIPHQTHQTEVRLIDEEWLQQSSEQRQLDLEGVDALLTSEREVCIGVSTADCIPVVVYAPDSHAVGVIHAGWRGTKDGIVEKTVDAMKTAFGCAEEQMECYIGPGISVRHFEGGDEVYEAFREAGFPMDLIAEKHHKWHIDLKRCNRFQLERKGVASHHIHDCGICTYADNSHYFSARVQGIHSGRIFTGAVLR